MIHQDGATAAPLSLDDPLAADPARSGRKAATLARLRSAGFPVPAGVVLPVTGSESGGPGGAVTFIRRHLGPGPVAVRSSSPVEDGALASAAGRYLTLLQVPPRDPDLAEAARRVRDSAAGEGMAVLIQPMVDAAAAGVAFGADPVTGDRDAVHISAVRGLADRLVAGSAEADQWVVTGSAAQRIRGVDGVITPEHAVEIARLVTALGEREGAPQDVEWAIDRVGMHLLQCRPITALPTPPEMDLPPGTWVGDPHRYPNGMTPFGLSIAAPEVSSGLTGVFARCGALIERVELRGVAGKPYLRFVPVGGRDGKPPPGPVLGLLARTVPALRERCRTAQALLRSGSLDADIEQWNRTGRDEARHGADELLAVDVTALTDAGLANHLEQVRDALRRGLAIHFRLMAPHLVGVYQLVRTCEEVLHWSRPQALALLAGLSPASAEPARELARLAERIAGHPTAGHAVLGASDGGATLRGAAPDLADEFDAWRHRYGMRTANDDPGSPTLLEIPGLLTGLLADQVRSAARRHGCPEPDGPARASGAAAIARARSELATKRPRERRRFDSALAAAMAAYPIREDNVLWALAVPSGLARRAALEIGARLRRRGEIDDARDVVMLDIDTVLRAARSDTAPPALRPAVARARAERAWVSAHPLPAHFGPPPSMPDLRFLPRSAQLVNEALHMDAPRPGRDPAAPLDRTGGILLTGVAASAGRYTGPVRIVREPLEFGSLRPGDVLVCAVTDPAWSVLFAVAGAVVADGGSELSHAAIIAREHGIPAVLGTRTATRDLADGRFVTVDGAAGVVLAAGHP